MELVFSEKTVAEANEALEVIKTQGGARTADLTVEKWFRMILIKTVHEILAEKRINGDE